ncbi:MAG TPA: tetratricopeptide repeat protein [Actinoplanes sp.]|nr:tetratricopeptide repeat protein [Actinoplanes sp.]
MPADITTVAELGQLLRRLRRRQARTSGTRELTYRQLAERTGWSHGIIGEYLGGRVLPPTDRFDVLVRLLGATSAEQGAFATVRDRLEELRRPGVVSRDVVLVPRELPAPSGTFAARTMELSRLEAMLPGPRPVVISGMAGVGKTTLALHWARSVADRFPDGQLYLNLRGFHPGDRVSVREALHHLLSSLGVREEHLPATVEAQARLYRTKLSGRRMLVVLDNVADAEHARPLLTPEGCLCVLTSRNHLAGLIVAEGAQSLTLHPLDERDGRDLLTHRLGADRLAGEDTAIRRIVAACGGLPLALALVAARATINPTFTLAEIATQLDQAAGGLTALRSDDVDTDVRAAFSCSYRLLPEAGRRMFRLLGLHPGPDISVRAAAALTATTPDEAHAVLDGLARTRLLTEHRPGRYVSHDLLRAYAAELVAHDDPADARRAAQDRLTDHIVYEACTAATTINPLRKPIALGPGATPATVEPYAGEAHALAWFRNEHRVLLAVLRLAVDLGADRRAWQLAWGIGEFLDRNGYLRDWAIVQATALEAAERLRDPAAQAFSHRVLANGCIRLDRPEEALDHLARALDLYLSLGDLADAATTLYLTAWAHSLHDDWQQALDHGERAVALARRAGDAVVLGLALNMTGYLHGEQGRYDITLNRCEEAAELQRAIGHRIGLSATLDTLGVAHQALGRHETAFEFYREGLRLHAELGDHYNEADMALRLGDAYAAAGDHTAAAATWRLGLTALEDVADPGVDGLREQLTARNTPRRPATTVGTGPHRPEDTPV